jgi:hypothetical protein
MASEGRHFCLIRGLPRAAPAPRRKVAHPLEAAARLPSAREQHEGGGTGGGEGEREKAEILGRRQQGDDEHGGCESKLGACRADLVGCERGSGEGPSKDHN